MTGRLKPRRLYWHFSHYWWGTRIKPYGIIRDGDWKLIRHYEDGRRELHDLARGLGETTDLDSALPAACRFSTDPPYELHDIGFRVVEVPEPAALALLALGGLAVVRWRRK